MVLVASDMVEIFFETFQINSSEKDFNMTGIILDEAQLDDDIVGQDRRRVYRPRTNMNWLMPKSFQ